MRSAGRIARLACAVVVVAALSLTTACGGSSDTKPAKASSAATSASAPARSSAAATSGGKSSAGVSSGAKSSAAPTSAMASSAAQSSGAQSGAPTSGAPTSGAPTPGAPSSAKKSGPIKTAPAPTGSSTELISAGQQALAAARNVHFVGDVQSGGTPLHVDSYAYGGAVPHGRVVVTARTQAYQAVVNGQEIYIKAKLSYSTAAGVPVSKAKTFVGRYVRIPASGRTQFASLVNLVNTPKLAKIVFGSAYAIFVEPKAGPRTGGRKTVQLKDSKNNTVIFAATTASRSSSSRTRPG
ncbi:MAG: hypothetical protein ACR2F6_14680 [Mycobacteriales bacterium]